MITKRATLTAAVMAIVGLGVSGQAAASIYAGSMLEIIDLTVDVQTVTSPPLTGFSFNLDNTATLNSVSDTTAGISSNCNNLGLPACSAGSPVLTAVAANAPGGAPLRVDGAGNNFSFFGPGASQTYANSDSQINTAQLIQGIPTSTIQISEAEVAGTGAAQSSTNVQSNTQFTFSFDVVGGGSLVLDFDADPDLYVAVDTVGLEGALAQANTSATFTLFSNDAGVNVRWTPDGVTAGNVTDFSSCVGVTNCVEDNDGESLNNAIGLPPNQNPGDAGISDARFGNETAPIFSNFGISITGLSDGSYTLVLAATSSVNVVQRVPEPSMLALLGLSVVSLGFVTYYRRRKA